MGRNRGRRAGGTAAGPTAEPPSATHAPNPGQPDAPGQPGLNPAEQKPLTFLLLRYFDYTVEPGKHYVYRVRLVLANPNYIPPQASRRGGNQGCQQSQNVLLEGPQAGRGAVAGNRVVRAEPGDLHAVRHPRPGDVRQSGAGADRPRHAGQVGGAGLRSLPRGNVVRGQVINFLDTTFTHNATANPRAGGMAAGRRARSLARGWPRRRIRASARCPADAAPPRRRTRRGPGDGRPSARRRRPRRAAAARRMARRCRARECLTRACRMAWHGRHADGPRRPHHEVQGQLLLQVDRRRLPRRRKSLPPHSLYAPGEILLWEPDGTLSIRNELEDKAAIEQLKAAEAPPAPRPAAPRFQAGQSRLTGAAPWTISSARKAPSRADARPQPVIGPSAAVTPRAARGGDSLPQVPATAWYRNAALR